MPARTSAGFLVLAAVVAMIRPAPAQTPSAPAKAPEPILYELMINGETFLVEAQRAVKLQSQRPGGPAYDVALRVAPTQRVRLENFQFDYDMPATVQHQSDNSSVRVRHELGFTLLVSDLGRTLTAPQREQALARLVDSARGTFQEMAAHGVTLAKPHERKFAAAAATGVTLRYVDRQNLGHTCLIYVFTGEGFAGSCLAQYLDRDEADVLPLVKKVLESLRPAA